MPREFSRGVRVASELHRLLNELLQSEVKDPRLHGVRVSEVEMSRDLGVAKVYYSLLRPDDDPAEAERAFAKARGFLRGRAGRALELRRAPELRFEHDRTAERGIELTRLIDSHDPDRGAR